MPSSPSRSLLSCRTRGIRTGANAHDYWFDTFDGLDVIFRCEAGPCIAARLQIGAVKQIELGALDGRKPIDVTSVAKVLPEARLRVPIDAAVKASLQIRDHNLIRAVAECFTVASQPVEWDLPCLRVAFFRWHAAWAIVIRLLPATNALDLVSQPKAGKEIPFEPDWRTRLGLHVLHGADLPRSEGGLVSIAVAPVPQLCLGSCAPGARTTRRLTRDRL